MYISKEAAIQAVGELYPASAKEKVKKMTSDYADGICAAINALDEVPAVDAVEVVRCKDCEWWDKFSASSMFPQFHECHGRIAKISTRGEDYCSLGERKEDE